MGKYKFSTTDDSGAVKFHVEVDLDRGDRNISKAQYQLDSMIMTDMTALMPHQMGGFINVTKAISEAIAGTGKVVAAAPPKGRFLYEGKTMVDEVTGSPWARKGAKKVLVSQYAGKTNASPMLTYSHGRQSHWFEEAKKRHVKEWIRKVKETVGGK